MRPSTSSGPQLRKDKNNLNQPNPNAGVYHIRVDSNVSSAVPISTFLEEEKKEVEDNIC